MPIVYDHVHHVHAMQLLPSFSDYFNHRYHTDIDCGFSFSLISFCFSQHGYDATSSLTHAYKTPPLATASLSCSSTKLHFDGQYFENIFGELPINFTTLISHLTKVS